LRSPIYHRYEVHVCLKSSAIFIARYPVSVGTSLEQGVNPQLLVEEGNGKPPRHQPSSHFPSLDDTGFPQLVSSRTCLTAEHLASLFINTPSLKCLSCLLYNITYIAHDTLL